MYIRDYREGIDSNVNQDTPDQKRNDSKAVILTRLKITGYFVCTIGLMFIIGRFLYKNAPAQMPTFSAANSRDIANADEILAYSPRKALRNTEFYLDQAKAPFPPPVRLIPVEALKMINTKPMKGWLENAKLHWEKGQIYHTAPPVANLKMHPWVQHWIMEEMQKVSMIKINKKKKVKKRKNLWEQIMKKATKAVKKILNELKSKAIDQIHKVTGADKKLVETVVNRLLEEAREEIKRHETVQILGMIQKTIKNEKKPQQPKNGQKAKNVQQFDQCVIAIENMQKAQIKEKSQEQKSKGSKKKKRGKKKKGGKKNKGGKGRGRK